MKVLDGDGYTGKLVVSNEGVLVGVTVGEVIGGGKKLNRVFDPIEPK